MLNLPELKRTDLSRRATEFNIFARALMAGKAEGSALKFAERTHAPKSVIDCLKTNVTGATTENPSWGGPVAEYTAVVGGFLASVATIGCFDGILPDMQPGQLRSQFGVVTGNATAYVNLQGAAKPTSRLTLAGAILTEKKIASFVVLSNEIVRFNRGAADLVGRSLRVSVASATDEVFVDTLIAAVTPGTATGTDAEGIYRDLRVTLDAVEVGDGSRLHVILSPTTAKFLSLLATSSGAAAFPAMSPTGGAIGNMPVHISTHADSNVLIIDASALVAATPPPSR